MSRSISLALPAGFVEADFEAMYAAAEAHFHAEERAECNSWANACEAISAQELAEIELAFEY